MELQILIIVAALMGLIFGIMGFILGTMALVTIRAMEKSTHTITYKPIDEEIDRHNQELTSKWATEESVIEKDKKMYREELEKDMPEFAPSEEDEKTYSF